MEVQLERLKEAEAVDRNCCNKMSDRTMAASNSHSKSDDASILSQQQQVRELRNRNEPEPCIIKEVPLPIAEAEWIRYIQEYSYFDARSPSVVSIFRVTGSLMQVSKNTGAYIPKRVSLGPYHHGCAQLVAMERHKPRALSRMMRRFNRGRSQPDSMDFCVSARRAIMEMHDVIKEKYDEILNYKGEMLAAMLTLDGCFILEILRLLAEQVPDEGYDPIFQTNKLNYGESDLLDELLKLENQIPFIVLQKLLQLELESFLAASCILSLTVANFLVNFYPFDFAEVTIDSGVTGHHLLDIFRTFVVFASTSDGGANNTVIGVGSMGSEDSRYTTLSNECEDDEMDREGERRESIPCANSLRYRLTCWLYTLIGSPSSNNGDKSSNNTNEWNIPRAMDLSNAGIKFKRIPGGITNIHFDPKRATIYLPLLQVCDSTEVAFRNLRAFEMRMQFKANYVVSYTYLMGKLMVSEEDVLLLKREGVLHTLIGSNVEVANLFNLLSKGAILRSNDFLSDLARQLDVHCKNKWNVYRAVFVKDHFSSPWKILGLVAATLLVLLTFVQTIFTILGVYK